MNRRLSKADPKARALFVSILALACALPDASSAQTAASATDATSSPVFQSDSAKFDAIRDVEAGKTAVSKKDSGRTLARNDSLVAKLKRRGPYVGLSAGLAFAEHSARDLFTAEMSSKASAKGERILQKQDPVHVFFPVGLMLGYPVSRHFDAIVRTEHIYYRVTGLGQKDNEAPTEYGYTQQAHFAGAGVRWLLPVSLLTVSGQPGLFLSYTHLWSFGPTGIRTSDGSVRAFTDPAGAGFEIQSGFQQDFDKRWILVGGLSFSRLALQSHGDWSNVAFNTGSGSAEWTITSMRFALQGLYQFGRSTK
jgi:hypothetical protein